MGFLSLNTSPTLIELTPESEVSLESYLQNTRMHTYNQAQHFCAGLSELDLGLGWVLLIPCTCHRLLAQPGHTEDTKWHPENKLLCSAIISSHYRDINSTRDWIELVTFTSIPTEKKEKKVRKFKSSCHRAVDQNRSLKYASGQIKSEKGSRGVVTWFVVWPTDHPEAVLRSQAAVGCLLQACGRLRHRAHPGGWGHERYRDLRPLQQRSGTAGRTWAAIAQSLLSTPSVSASVTVGYWGYASLTDHRTRKELFSPCRTFEFNPARHLVWRQQENTW